MHTARANATCTKTKLGVTPVASSEASAADDELRTLTAKTQSAMTPATQARIDSIWRMVALDNPPRRLLGFEERRFPKSVRVRLGLRIVEGADDAEGAIVERVEGEEEVDVRSGSSAG